MERGPSPLELLHPDGIARYVSVIGKGCPDVLRPKRPVPRAGEQADLVIVAPTRAELRERTWPQGAVEKAAGVLAADGVVYVLSPPRWRRRFSRLLAERGLGLKVSLAHDPDAKNLRCLVPLSPEVATYAYTNLIATRPGRRRLVLGALRVGWLVTACGRHAARSGLRCRRRHEPASLRLALPRDGCRRSRTAGRPERELAGLERVSRRPRFRGWSGTPVRGRKGARIGDTRGGRRGRRHPTPRPGSAGSRCSGPRAPARRDRPEQSGAVRDPGRRPHGCGDPRRDARPGRERDYATDNMVEELESQHALGRGTLRGMARACYRRTRTHPPPGRGPLPAVPDSLCRSLVGTTVAFVATHNDLTMVNVFVAQSGALGIVDWEAGRERDLPLVDFYYGAADAAAAGTRYADRPGAFREQFEESARAGSFARQLEARLARTLDLSPAAVELAFHACWIRHAVTEQPASDDPAPRPFLEILRSVANAAR